MLSDHWLEIFDLLRVFLVVQREYETKINNCSIADHCKVFINSKFIMFDHDSILDLRQNKIILKNISNYFYGTEHMYYVFNLLYYILNSEFQKKLLFLVNFTIFTIF